MTALKFKKVKNVTLQLFKLKPNGPAIYFRVEGEMFVGKKLKQDEKKEPATLMNVINLETGELGQIICPAVLKGTLEDEYVEKKIPYVGKCFEMSVTRVASEAYNRVNLTEIEVDQSEIDAAAARTEKYKAAAAAYGDEATSGDGDDATLNASLDAAAAAAAKPKAKKK